MGDVLPLALRGIILWRILACCLGWSLVACSCCVRYCFFCCLIFLLSALAYFAWTLIFSVVGFSCFRL